MTMPTRRIQKTTIEQIRRAIQDAPECESTGVTKVQAIRVLIPDIQQMQAKGYDWKAIASLFCEQGIEVTAVTLKSYLQQAKADRRRRRRKPRSVDGPGKSRAERGGRVAAGGTASLAQADAASVAKAPGVTPPVAAGKAVRADPPTAVRTPPPDAGTRRSAFVPEEDSDDL